jgi:3-oxoacyl-[acyl-carrier protein] reductase
MFDLRRVFMATLDHKVALVTGGSRGIGAAIVERLCAEGAAVAFTYLASSGAADALAQKINQRGGKALAILADSADVSQIKSAVQSTFERYGGLDILVNNAGVEVSGTIYDYSLEDLDRSIAVNIRGLFVATQEAVRHMHLGGRVINIGSVSSDFMPIPGHAIYAMTKGAVGSLTRGLARDLGPRGITVNNVQPGRVDTELMRAALGQLAERARAGIAVERFGKVEEVAGLVAFLAGPEASYITGASLKIDGGASS